MWINQHLAESPNRALLDADSKTILDQVLMKISNPASPGDRSLVIFDIDSTLIDTSHRTAAICREFARQPSHNSQFKELCREINQWTEWVEVYHPIDFINMHSGIKIKPHSVEEAFILKFWKDRFFHEDWLVHDLPYSGGKEFVTECLLRGADIAYLTGRHKDTSIVGTKKWLATHHFPLKEGSARTRLMLKEHTAILDLDYKNSGLAQLKVGYDSIWFIENEVELILMALSDHQDVEAILFDSVHSGRAELQEIKPKTITSWVR